ncbi:MAG: flavin reductase family protein [Phycisphaerales bacterium]|nr:flavin reductase family protein [Phycisphaerales bacterium]
MILDPLQLDAAGRYKLLIGGIVPRPIAVVGTVAGDGSSRNLAPFSFFNGVGSDPMTLLFCPSLRDDGSEKDTLRNCKPVNEGGTGEFTVNIASEDIIRQVVAAGEHMEYGEEEFARVGLTPIAGTRVKAPRVAESPMTFECITRQVIRLASQSTASPNIVIGEVVLIHIADGILDEKGRVNPQSLGAVGRMGGLTLVRTRERFDLPFGLPALSASCPFA